LYAVRHGRLPGAENDDVEHDDYDSTPNLRADDNDATAVVEWRMGGGPLPSGRKPLRRWWFGFSLFKTLGMSFRIVQTGPTVTMTAGSGTATLNADGSLRVSTSATWPAGDGSHTCSRSVVLVATLEGMADASMLQECPSYVTPVGWYPGYSCDAAYTGTLSRQ